MSQPVFSAAQASLYVRAILGLAEPEVLASTAQVQVEAASLHRGLLTGEAYEVAEQEQLAALSLQLAAQVAEQKSPERLSQTSKVGRGR